MKTARLISATAAVAAGVALLSPGGSSYASWVDQVTVPGASLSSGRLDLNDARLSVTVIRASTENPIVNVPELRIGDTVVIRTSTAMVVEGDALSATLALDDGLLLANGTRPGSVSTTISTDPDAPGLVGDSFTGWEVAPIHSGTTATATITLPITEENRTVGDGRVVWSLTQKVAGASRAGWSSTVSVPFDLPAVADHGNQWRPQVTGKPDDLGAVGNVKTFKFSWTWNQSATPATFWQLLQSRNGRWEVLKSANGSVSNFTVTSDEVKEFATNGGTTEFLVRVYPTGPGGDYFDATHAYRMEYTSSAGHMKFIQLVPVADGAVR